MIRCLSEPVPLFSVGELRAWLRIDDSSDDVLLVDLLRVATERLDGRDGDLGIQLASCEYELSRAGFARTMSLEIGNVASIVSVTYRDPAGQTQTDPLANWQLDDSHDQPTAKLWHVADRAFPAVADASDAVKVRFVAGYGTPAQVPAPIRHAVRLHVAAMYDTRESARFGTGGFVTNPDVATMLSAYKRRWGC